MKHGSLRQLPSTSQDKIGQIDQKLRVGQTLCIFLVVSCVRLRLICCVIHNTQTFGEGGQKKKKKKINWEQTIPNNCCPTMCTGELQWYNHIPQALLQRDFTAVTEGSNLELRSGSRQRGDLTCLCYFLTAGWSLHLCSPLTHVYPKHGVKPPQNRQHFIIAHHAASTTTGHKTLL